MNVNKRILTLGSMCLAMMLCGSTQAEDLIKKKDQILNAGPTKPVPMRPLPTVARPPSLTPVQPAPPTAMHPAPPTADQPAPPTAMRPAPPTADQPAPPTAMHPAPPAADQPAPPTAMHPAPPTADQPAPPTGHRNASQSELLPDLFISRYDWRPSPPNLQSALSVRVLVVNKGQRNSGSFNVQWWPGENYQQPGCTWRVGNLQVMGSRILQCSGYIYPSWYGQVKTVVIVDSEQEVMELDEMNNRLDRETRVNK